MKHDALESLIVSEQATIREAMLSFDRSALRVVLICDVERRLLGLATEGDIRRALLAGNGLLTLVMSIANRNPIVGKTIMSREELVNLLSERVYFLPILNEKGVIENFLSFDKRSAIPIASPTIGERE